MGHKRPRPERLGDKLREIRLAFELSQDLIRTRLGFGHIHPGRISEYETGKRVPPPMLLLAYADLAGVHVEDLLNDNLDLPKKLPGKVRHGVIPPSH